MTKRAIREVLTEGISVDVGFLETEIQTYHFSGILTDGEFLQRLYDIKSMPGSGGHCKTLDKEIWQHTVNNGDYETDWVFDDERFPLVNGSDEEYLRFICEMFHPEVRNEKLKWQTFLFHINNLLKKDNYEIYPTGIISGRDVYGWRDLKAKKPLTYLKEHEITFFLDFFNRGGYVLNFSTPSYDRFTSKVIGVELCARYGLSKGKSLERFANDANEQEIIKLFRALFEYYETQDLYNKERVSDTKYGLLYKKCKVIFDNLSNIPSIIDVQIKSAAANFSNEYIKSQFQLMAQFQKENPTEAIGKAKELIESCCITILERCGKTIEKKWDYNRLVTETRKLLQITPNDIKDNIPEAETMRSLLGSLATIANNIAQLRNVYGSGHGKSDSYKGLQERHAKLAIGCSMTLVNFLWDSFERHNRK